MGKWLVVLYTILMAISTNAQVTAPSYSNEYLNIGVGARALALGNSSLADPIPEEAGFWNPSFLTNLDSGRHLSLMHSEYFGGVASFDYVAYSSNWNESLNASLSLIRLGVDDIPDTRLLYDASGRIDYNQIDFFSAADYALILSGARKFSSLGDLSLGANVKLIYRRAGDFASAYGMGMDIGTFKQVGEFVVSAMIKDVFSTFTIWSHSQELLDEVYASTGNSLNKSSTELTLPQVQLGLSRSLFSTEDLNLKSMMGVQTTFDGKRNTLINSKLVSIDPALGFELGYKEIVFVRTGFSKFQKVFLLDEWRAEWSFGSGINYKALKFHYALNRSNGFLSSHYSHSVSLNLRLNSQ